MSTTEANFKRADRLYHGAIKVAIVFGVVMLCVIAYQVAHLQGDFTRQQSAAASARGFY